MKIIATLIVGAFVSTAVLAADKTTTTTTTTTTATADKGHCTVINPDGTKTQSESTKNECKGTFEVSSAKKDAAKK